MEALDDDGRERSSHHLGVYRLRPARRTLAQLVFAGVQT